MFTLPSNKLIVAGSTGQVLQRRCFLRTGLWASLSVGVVGLLPALTYGQGIQPPKRTPKGYFAVPPEALHDPLAALTRSNFSRFNGDYFETIKDDGERLLIVLLRVEDLPSQRDLETKRRVSRKSIEQARAESFTLIFAGPLNLPLRQRIHKFRHPALGELEMFLVPAGQDEAARFYAVTFNRTLE